MYTQKPHNKVLQYWSVLPAFLSFQSSVGEKAQRSVSYLWHRSNKVFMHTQLIQVHASVQQRRNQETNLLEHT